MDCAEKGARQGEPVMTSATGVGFIEMRISKVVAVGRGESDILECVVLDEVHGDRHLVIEVGSPEAFSLAATLGGTEWRRPMTYQFLAAVVESLGARVRQVRLDRVIDGAYAATVELEGPAGTGLVDARSSDALNLAALANATVFAALEVLDENEHRRVGDEAQAALLRRAPDLPPMTVRRAGPTEEPWDWVDGPG
jgi:bifunctional DNase/RNase